MTITQATLVVVLLFVGTLFLISFRAAKSNIPTPDDYFLGGRGLGTVVLMMTMGATYFSTWTLLGAFGSYYRTGIWFMGFSVWTIFHALFIWLFGVRIWMAGKKFGFVTPGEMMEHYYKSPTIRVLFALVGIVGLVPYMLIQVTGGAMALEGLTKGDIPYFVGVIIMSVMVGVLVLLSGYRGAAWTDTFMGIFFGAIVLIVAFAILGKAGGFDAFKTVAQSKPELMTNKGDIPGMLETMTGLGLGFWVMPHMWQKYYSAKSPKILGKVSVITPFFNSWLMAVIPLLVGIAANVPGVIPNLSTKTSDQLIPLFFAHYAPLAGTIVIAGILAAGISTINSQLLSSASIFAADIWMRFFRRDMSQTQATLVSKITVVVLTLIIFILALTPNGSGFLIPVSALGFGIVLQLVPAALGALYWRRITAAGAITGIVAGLLVLVTTKIFAINSFFGPGLIGPGLNGLILNLAFTWAVSLFTARVPTSSIRDYHDFYKHYLSADDQSLVSSKTEGEMINA